MSLPLRECGLKFRYCEARRTESWSLPLRECGLKYDKYAKHTVKGKSLPLRECGLKSVNEGINGIWP